MCFNPKYFSPNQKLQKSLDVLKPGYQKSYFTNDVIHFGKVIEQHKVFSQIVTLIAVKQNFLTKTKRDNLLQSFETIEQS
jgi:hypothetical protein